MEELESQLTKREMAVGFNFDHLKHRIWCYAHIINICSSHIISSMTSVSEQYLSELEVPVDSNRTLCRDSEDELDDDDDDDVDADPSIELNMDDSFDDRDNPELKEWFAGIKRDPLRRARKVIRLLRSSDQRRDGFRDFIRDGNRRNWFFKKTDDDRTLVKVPEVQPLRDVKTRWDSVYLMLERLRQLRPVSSS